MRFLPRRAAQLQEALGAVRAAGRGCAALRAISHDVAHLCQARPSRNTHTDNGKHAHAKP
jgi:hypothetical protein